MGQTAPRGALKEYVRKRDFARTPEPRGRTARRPTAGAPQFVVQQHAARRLHYDFRLELDGVLKSWAVPKGPSLDSSERRMAVQTEDHPLEYAGFEGVIPKGEYGGGTVVVWDRGRWEPIGDARAGLANGKLEFQLFGTKLTGRWHLVRTRGRAGDRGKRTWLLIKGRDAATRSGKDAEITQRATASVRSGRDLAAVAAAADRVWSNAHAEVAAKSVAKRARANDPVKRPRSKRAPQKGAIDLPQRPLPRFIAPQLATLVDAPPRGAEWLHERKLDGYRIAARIENGAVQLLTRSGKDWTPMFGNVAGALARLPVRSALIDGEVVVNDAQGHSRFQLLQNALERHASVEYYAFDLLHLDGFDLRAAPLLARKELLEKLLGRQPAAKHIHYCEHVSRGADAFFARECKRGEEGIVSKLASAAYVSGRTRSWLEVKCHKRQEFVVVGFTEPRGSRVGLGALLLGVYDDAGALRFSGKVGTGFSGALLAELREKLAKLERAIAPVVDPQRAERGAHWVEPKLVAEVEFTEWTDDGKVRHPSFVALRTDKPAAAIRRETPELAPRSGAPNNPTKSAAHSAAPPAERAEVAGVRLSNPGRVYWPDVGVTKSELAQYWETVSERALPLLARRPLSLVRCPDGVDAKCFFQKHATATLSKQIGRVPIRRGEDPYAMVTDLRSLVALVQIGVIELHPWGSRADAIEKPDLFILDLDPDPAVPWRRLAETALLLRGFLAELGFVPFLRTTGGKGLHVVAPITRRSSWEEVKAFTHAVALRIVREAPHQFTAEIPKAKRRNKILIDYLRNQPEATAIASYSPRARPGAPVAMPLAWDELDPRAKAPPRWSVRDAAARLAQPDPWAAFETSRRALTQQIQDLVRVDGE
jgi:bifunctional non-homologous end joining protein LigD